MNTLCAYRLTYASRATSGQAAMGKRMRAPLGPTDCACKQLELCPLRMHHLQGVDSL